MLKNFVLSCLLSVTLGFDVAAQLQDINFTSLTSKDGLSSNTVKVILKDRYGLMWIGTEDGLNKFDGSKFTVYRRNPADSTSLQSNETLALFEDKTGTLWVGTSGGSLSRYDRKRDAFITYPSSPAANTLDNNVIMSITADHFGKLWIAHFEGVNILDPATGIITRIATLPGLTIPQLPHTRVVFEDSQQRMWIGTEDGLFQYDHKAKAFTVYKHADEDPMSLAGSYVNAIAEDAVGNIWIGTNGGLSKLARGQSTFINYYQHSDNTKGLIRNFVHALAFSGEQLWIGTGEGLNILDTRTGVFSAFKQDYRNIHSLTAKTIRSIFVDKDGISWLGTFGGGINKYDKNLNIFNSITSNVFDEKGLNASIVTAFAHWKEGKIYVGTERKGLSLFDMRTKLFEHLHIQSRIKTSEDELSILTLEMTAQKELLIGTYANGLFVLNPASGKYSQLIAGPNQEDLNSNDIFCIKELNDGNIWVGTNGNGVNVLDKQKKVILKITPNPKAATDVKFPINGFIRAIEVDNENNTWIATHGGGIAVYNAASGKFILYNTGNSKLPNDKVQSMLRDSKGNMWVATFGGGLGLMVKNTKDFITFSESNGLQNSTVYKVLEDRSGLIWVSTNMGISSIDVNTKKINNYNNHNGVQNNNFYHGAGIILPDGEMFFGGLEGFNYFNPINFKKNNSVPQVLITELKIANETVAPTENGPLTTHISIAKEINLDYKQNFALSFVGLNYTAPEQNQYAYKLEGFDKDWNNVGTSNTASYTNLDPGEYTFRVRASNNDGVWNNEGTSIKIYVHPPFWLSPFAYAIYIISIVGLLFFSRYKGIQKLKKKFALEEEKKQVERDRKEAERLRELDQLKIKFLTNLSHEFRTPISLILGPVDQLLVQEENHQWRDQLQIIKRNGKRLLNLVNQLLDFRKIEENELKLQVSKGDLITFIKDVFDSFTDLAQRKQIVFEYNSSINRFETNFDHDKIERILFNLFSNAFKFTLEGGKISLNVELLKMPNDPLHHWIVMKIKDSGIGIPTEKKEKIFERFFQASTVSSILNQGSGIGLSITKEFVKMQGGTIEVESEVGVGTTFCLQLPFVPVDATANNGDKPAVLTEAEQAIEEEAEEVWIAETGKADTKNWAEKPSILLVEDNEDFRFYLKDNLRTQYKVLEAGNGKEGWKRALAEHPELIVSDISMPYMDGVELCHKLKADKRTHHIPIILLTALAGEEDQLRGLKIGANDYITKPFNFEILNAKIKNLLVLNSTFKETYTRQIKVETTAVEIESTDDKLLKSIVAYLEENITNSQLSVEELSKHLGMSRSSLYSKLLEITGQTPVEYIRSVKLEKATVLLEKSNMNIAEIAYSVGFSTPNYFAKSFKAKYNMLPSEYLNRMRKESKQKNAE